MNLSIDRIKAEYPRGFIDGLNIDRSNLDWEALEIALDKIRQKYNELLDLSQEVEL